MNCASERAERRTQPVGRGIVRGRRRCSASPRRPSAATDTRPALQIEKPEDGFSVVTDAVEETGEDLV